MELHLKPVNQDSFKRDFVIIMLYKEGRFSLKISLEANETAKKQS